MSLPKALALADGAAVLLRAAAPHDEPFLLALYADRRAEELAGLDWPPEQVRAFVEMQFRAQQQGYGTSFPGARSTIVVAGDEPVGRLLVDLSPGEHRLVDVALLRSWRGRGIGTALVRDVLAGARDSGVPVGITVAAGDPRLVGWYRRLGFTVTRVGVYDLGMTCVPGG